ncbi:MAG: hypothetical protein NTZ05_21855, partial [Chloroflexi bacterium]|nr:hypothetical protein [Chloroflexota bacterium]
MGFRQLQRMAPQAALVVGALIVISALVVYSGGRLGLFGTAAGGPALTLTPPTGGAIVWTAGGDNGVCGDIDIRLRSECSVPIVPGATVQLTPQPIRGYRFVRWTGA